MARLRRLIGILRAAAGAFHRDHGVHLAAGLAFFAVLSLIPLCLIMISFLGHVLGQSDVLFHQAVVWVSETIPGVEANFVELLRGLVARRISTGGLGLVTLGIAASLLFTGLEGALDRVLRTPRRRRLVHSYLLAAGLIALTSLAFLIPALVGLVADLVAQYGVRIPVARLFQGDHFFFVGHVAGFACLVRLVPNQSPRMRSVLSGAILFATLALVARVAYRLYMGFAMERFHLIYGPLTVVVIFILWLYYLSCIFLFCAEVVGVLEQERRRVAVHPSTRRQNGKSTRVSA